MRIFFLLVSDAKELLKKDIFGLSDPYVKISYRSSTRHFTAKTATVKKSLRPKWNEVIRVNLRDEVHFSIILDVYDENILSRDDFLGRAVLHFDLTTPTAGMTGEMYSTESLIRLHGTGRSKNLLDKWADRHLDGYLQLPHVRDMEHQFRGKRYSGIRESHPSWGHLQVYYTIYDPRSRSTSDPQPQAQPSAPSLTTPPAEVTSSSDDSDSSDSEAEELPSGWERRVDSNGRRVFVNHHHRRASLRNPARGPLLQQQQQQQQQQSEQPQSASASGSEDARPPLHHRAFLQRNHSIDVIQSLAEEEDDDDAESEHASVPPNAESESVLRPLDSVELGFSVSAQRTSEAASGGGGAAAASHTPQLQTALERASQGLPQGWEASMTPAGRIYYINHNTQTTTWEKPRYQEVRAKPEPAAVAQPVEQDPELPDGWEARKDVNGRTYYVDHNTKRTTWDHPRQKTASSSELGPLPAGWEEKQMRDGRIFFIDHNTHSTQWEDPRLLAKNKPTARIQYSRDYKQKYTNFRSKLAPKHEIPRQLDIPCRRDHLLEDTYNVIMNIRDVEMLKSRLYVIFEGETGLDYGGVAREWFHLLSHEMFNPYYGLFEYSASDDYTLQINPESETYNENHLDYFKFIGRICGMAVYHNRLIDAFFIRPFYKMMLKKAITLDDMQSVDVEMWNSFTYILENDPEPLCLDFSVNKTVFDEVILVDLKPGGRDIPVTEQNKREYINLMMKWRFTDRVQKQMDAFMKGFSDLIPPRLLRVFDERELEYLLGGLSQIDVEDWKRNTEYSGYYATDQVVEWFWKAVENYDEEMRARLLQFVTGTSKVPMNGFSELQGSQGPRKFCLKRFGQPNSFPRAHTCFNRIDLPPYSSYHKLKEMLRLAVENTEGFEGVD